MSSRKEGDVSVVIGESAASIVGAVECLDGGKFV